MSDILYAAQISNGIVTQVIAGTTEWASANLGGFWVETNDKVWVGGTWDEVNGFQPVAVEEPAPE